MISYIRGILADKGMDKIVIEAGQIGYGVYVSTPTLELLPPIGSEVKIYTHLQVREDDMSLYGFASLSDLEMFRRLLGVNGIGPKGALGVLSVLPADALRMAIITGDAKAISKAPGVGAKTAQRIILDLKDKVSEDELLANIGSAEPMSAATGVSGSDGTSNQEVKDAIDGLVALGYSTAEALKAVKNVENVDGMDSEAILKASLKYLAFL